MAKSKPKKRNDEDFLNMGTQELMKKYKMTQQQVYVKRSSIKSKLKKNKPKHQELASIPEMPRDQPQPEQRELLKKNVSRNNSDHRHIELTFGDFTIRLSESPQQISINPDNKAIDIIL